MAEEQIVARLRELLQEVDLEKTTEKMLRKQLEQEFNCDLGDKKPLIRAEVERYLAECGSKEGEEEEEEEAEDEEDDDDDEGDKDKSDKSIKSAPPKRGSAFGSVLSEAMQQFLGVQSMPRTQVVKHIWQYIKDNNLQDPKDKRKILLDDQLSTIFTAPLNMLTINQQLSRHCKTNDAASASGKTSGSSSSRPAKRAAENKADNGRGKKPRAAGSSEGKSGFTKQLQITDELAKFVGKPTISRPELTKFFWEYFKSKGVQDPSNKGLIICDGPLKALTGQDSFKAFGFQKHISQHILKDK